MSKRALLFDLEEDFVVQGCAVQDQDGLFYIPDDGDKDGVRQSKGEH